MSPTLTRICARTSSSLADCGPTCWIRIFATLGPAATCACAGMLHAMRIQRKVKARHGTVAARSGWHIFVTYFGGTLKTRKGLQECQVNVTRRAVALLGDQQI